MTEFHGDVALVGKWFDHDDEPVRNGMTPRSMIAFIVSVSRWLALVIGNCIEMMTGRIDQFLWGWYSERYPHQRPEEAPGFLTELQSS